MKPLFLAATVAALACSGPSVPDLERARAQAESESRAELVEPLADNHRGPEVATGGEGPARFAAALFEAFQAERAFATATFADRYYREPGSDGYEATLDHIEAALREAGYGESEGLRLQVLEHEGELPAWTPRRARIVLRGPDGTTAILHAFEKESEADRVMLPSNAPAAKVTGRVCLELQRLAEGEILVTRSPLRRDLINRAAINGAAAIVSASLDSYNTDPTGADRHKDAIQYRVLLFAPALPVAQISPRSYEAIEAAVLRHGEAELAFECEVDLDVRPVRTLVATIVGAARPEEAVVVVGHIQEPGACENATGAAGLLESARLLPGLLHAKTLAWPARSLVFIWGEEMEQSRRWLAAADRRTVAALSSDMTGQSRERTGAIALLERMPDPGAVRTLPPDEHTPCGALPAEAASLAPNGLAVVARCALSDVGTLTGGWETAEHPWEGGSDHDVFIEAGIPALLFWHFTDFAYHTSLDRLSHVDPEEMRRTGVAILATALAVADPRPADLDRYLRSLDLERGVRVAACEEAGDAELAELWRTWCTGARMWLRDQCLGLAATGRGDAGPGEAAAEDGKRGH